MKLFIVLEMTSKGHSQGHRQCYMLYVYHPVFLTDRKSKLHLFSDRKSGNDLEGRSRHNSIGHITFC